MQISRTSPLPMCPKVPEDPGEVLVRLRHVLRAGAILPQEVPDERLRLLSRPPHLTFRGPLPLQFQRTQHCKIVIGLCLSAKRNSYRKVFVAVFFRLSGWDCKSQDGVGNGSLVMGLSSIKILSYKTMP